MIGLLEFVSVADPKSKVLLYDSPFAERIKICGELEVWVVSERRAALRVMRESVLWKNGKNMYLIDSVVRPGDEEYERQGDEVQSKNEDESLEEEFAFYI